MTDRYPDRIRRTINLIRKLMQSGAFYTKEMNKKYGVSAPQIACLLALYEDGPMSISRIADRIMLRASTLTGIVDRLEQKGLVTRTRNSPDRRIVTITLTESGRVLAADAPPPIQRKIVDGLERLSEEDCVRIVESLEILAGFIDAQEADLECEHSIM